MTTEGTLGTPCDEGGDGYGPEVRATLYGSLRWGFLAMHPDAYRILTDPLWTDGLGRAATCLIGPDEAPSDVLRDAFARFQDKDDFEGAYQAVFGTRLRCDPYGTDYSSLHTFQQARELADVVGFYRAFGYDVDGRVGERADHVGLELEFLYALSYREAAARAHGEDEAAGRFLEGSKSFLGEHLAPFMTGLAKRAAGTEMHPFFQLLTQWTSRLVAADAARLGVVPRALPDPTRILPQAPDTPGCDACPVAEPTPGGS